MAALKRKKKKAINDAKGVGVLSFNSHSLPGVHPGVL
jgi:hypothetical protein